MAGGRRQAVFGRRFARHLAAMVRVYGKSPGAWRGGLLMAGAVALELGTVYANVALSDAERHMMDALQDKAWPAFLFALELFAAISAGYVLFAAFRIYFRQLLEIRWRRVATGRFVDRWMSGLAYLQNELHRDAIDNPDQRIAEDVRDGVASALGLSLSLLSALATLVSFGGLLWTLSERCPIPTAHGHVHVPGYLLWLALAYAAISTWSTHIVGRSLVPLNFDRLRFEADFRYGLMRFRDNIELVALSRGEENERRGSLGCFQRVVENWWYLIAAQCRLTVFTGVIGQANGIVPLLAASPGFFNGLVSLGTIVQIRFAYGQVSSALIWFVNAYQEIARWRANVERLSAFADVLDATEHDLEGVHIRVVRSEKPVLRMIGVRLMAPDGHALIDTANATVFPGERVAIEGPSGVGKTIMLRAFAGLWPFGTGHIHVPLRAQTLFVPQLPYLPHGTLRAAVSYPAADGAFTDAAIGEVLETLGLGRLTGHLGETAPWDQQLSPNEQQRLAIARVLLNAPEWVFLDKATSALDADMEKRVYELLKTRLPHATVISVSHGPTPDPYYTRRWTMEPNEHGTSSLQAA